MRTTGLPPLGPAQPAIWPRESARVGYLVVLAWRAFIVITFLYFVFPSSALYLSGWHYLGGGAEFEKIHLATYLLIPTFAFIFFSDRQFQIRALSASLDPSFLSFVLTAGVVAFYAIMVKHVSIAPFIDTFFAAIVVTIGLIALPRQNVRTLRWMLDIFFMGSIAILFYEYLYTTRILPTLTGAEYQIEQFFRATAMFEGPLSAATLLGVYSLVNLIATPIRFSMRCLVRLLLSFAGFAAIFTTGGRTSLIAFAVILLMFLFVSLVLQARTGKINGVALIYFIVGAPTFLIMLLILWQYGIFDTMLARFENDIGSAFTRWFAVDLVFDMSVDDLWIGITPLYLSALESLQMQLGLAAIEISWVNFILVCGLPLTIALFITFTLFLFRFFPKICEPAVVFPALFLLLNVSASNGIWAKTTILTTSVALFLAFLRKDLTKA